MRASASQVAPPSADLAPKISVLACRRSSHAQKIAPVGPAAMPCSPSRAEPASALSPPRPAPGLAPVGRSPGPDVAVPPAALLAADGRDDEALARSPRSWAPGASRGRACRVSRPISMRRRSRRRRSIGRSRPRHRRRTRRKCPPRDRRPPGVASPPARAPPGPRPPAPTRPPSGRPISCRSRPASTRTATSEDPFVPARSLIHAMIRLRNRSSIVTNRRRHISPEAA